MSEADTYIPRDEAGALLEIRDLRISLSEGGDAITLVDDVSFEVRRGETVALVGESGSGKTLTARALIGLIPRPLQWAGSIRFRGSELSSMSELDMRRLRGGQLGMVFQEPRRSLNPAFTVGWQIAQVVERHEGLSARQAIERAMELMNRVRIDNPRSRIRQYPHELSGGMCQRVMIAMALAGRPKLLIADEPTTALDATVQREVLMLMAELQAELGLAMVLITHDLGVVAEVSDRVLVMYAGQVVEQAAVLSLFDRPLHPYSAGLLQSMPTRDGKLGSIPGRVPQPKDFTSHCRFANRCPVADSRCKEASIPVRQVADHQVRCLRAGDVSLAEAFQ